MDVTPKLQRKASLSLSKRLNHKRHSASPQNRLKTSTSKGAINPHEINSESETLQRSPSVISICSDGGIECTPPHKKMALDFDESMDFSPKLFDNSFSPTSLQSQTLSIDSPEVGWKWNRNSGNGTSGDARCNDKISLRTPDSAYAADSSFASAGSSSIEVAGNDRNQKQRNVSRKADQRKLLEQELRRVENSRAEEKLKQRCAKLEEQLKSAGTQKSKPNNQLSELNAKSNSDKISTSYDIKMKKQSTSSILTKLSVKVPTPEKPEFLKDFFDDSDSDCFLLQATQEIESEIEAKTQPVFINFASTTPKSSVSSQCSSIPHANSAPAATTTPPAISPVANTSKICENKEKHSFCAKFFEDDILDDWFVSLDEVALLATQDKKPRTSFQRYKSMPAETSTKSCVTLNKKDNNDNCILESKPPLVLSEGTAASSSSNLSKAKRHSSTHTLSSAATSYRSRRQL